MVNDTITNVKAILSEYIKPLQIKKLNVVDSVSYGCSWTASRKSIIAIILVGYADGFSRLASSKGVVLVNGLRAHVVGKIYTDFMMLDVTDCNKVTMNTSIGWEVRK